MSLVIPISNTPNWSAGAIGRDSSSGVGDEAIQILAELLSLKSYIQKSVSLGWQNQLINEIEYLRSKYAEEGWDGYDALPLSIESSASASVFTQLLPDNICIPELTPEDTGNLSFDWRNGDDLILSISVMPKKLIYAGIIGSEKIHGEQPFIREIPENVNKILTQYYSRVD